MASKNKLSNKAIIAIVLIVVIVAATAAVVYTVQTSFGPAPVVVGVHVGDSFTYNMTGVSQIGNGSTATTPDYLSEYNNTDYFQVNITGVSGTMVSFNTLWKFTNGTEIPKTEYIDVANGNDSGDFWAIYAANLNLNNLLRPKGYDNLIVNSTDTQTFTSGVRDRNYWSLTQYLPMLMIQQAAHNNTIT